MINKTSLSMHLKFVLTFILVIGLTVSSFAKESDEEVVKNFVMDSKHKIISYELTQPTTVRIRVGSKSGPLHRTLVNWQRQKKGRHKIKWNGLDSSKTFNVLDNKNFTFSFNYYLDGPDSSVITFLPQESNIVISDNFIGRVPKFTHISQIHKNHKKEFCKDIEVLFELPKNTPKTKRFYKIKGNTPIIIKLSDKDKLWFSQERFSINIFIDDIFIKGEALGYAPYTWNFNPKGINKGKHLVTVNIKGFNDHIGIGSLPIIIE